MQMFYLISCSLLLSLEYIIFLPGTEGNYYFPVIACEVNVQYAQVKNRVGIL